ncbi:WD repeat-containing protein 19 [Borealophlyctis nickersoniae]|nr:WD repeat-containing protein 19 [Borealophlyctis nickersoniae]
MPTLGGAWETSVAYLTNLKEVSVADQSQSTSRSASAQPKLIRKALEIEPTVVAVGQNHVGVALNNRAWFYSLQIESEVIPNDQRGIPNETPIIKEYLASVKTLHMNTDYAAALLSDGRLQLHTIEKAGSISTISLAPPAMRSQYDISPSAHSPSPAVPKSNKKLDVQQKIFPEKEVTTKTEGGAGGAGFSISCAALTAEFLVYGTANGVVHHYAVDEWVLVNEYKHEKEIQKVYPQYHGGTKCIFSDVLNDGYLVEPISNEVMQIPQWSANTQGVLWETSQAPGRSIFVTWDDEYITTYAYEAVTIKGPQCLVLGATKLPYGLKPLLLLSGMLTCQTPGGRLSVVPLATHEPDTLAQFTKLYPEEQEQGKRLQLLYTLGKLKDIWSLTDTITSHKPWIMLGEAALRVLDIHVARRAYRHVRNAGMVHTLDGLESIEDKTLLAGHIAAIFMDFNAAQELFLDSPNPLAALELRRNLLHWEQALSLATNLAPDEVTVIAREYAQQLEFDEKYSEAIAMYERALSTSDKHPGPDAARDDHQIACSAGLTRMTIRLGDISRGMKMLAHATDQQLLSDCGGILDGLKQYAEAASCYERCGKWERAAEVWIKAKNWQKIGSLLDKVTAPKIFVQYAKAKEAEGQYPEAARAYEKAKDYDSVVRLLVDHMQNIDGAVSIVRKTRSRDSAKIVAKFFQGIRDYRSVVEFYLMAGMREEAFELAQQRDVMDHYAELVKDDATHEELLNIASYFEHKRDYLSAGKHLLHCGEYPRALKMFLLCSAADGASIELAIETVGLAHNDSLTHQLIDYLMGETDGLPKDAKYIFKLYMSLGQYKEAARTAVIIAREEQTLGNYRAAHDLLLDNYRQLRATKEKVPSEIDRMLMLLHSYILVKTLVRAGEHEKGARMLIRVSSNISKFPAHIVPILTSTVIECHRVGLKRSAFEYAAMLMRPEYRNQVDAKYKRKIEQIVRRPEKEEPEETMTPCPYCDNPVPETSLDCIECKNHLPYCIATGRHMTTNDWTTCPNCAFPALMSHFADLLAKSPTCPMCATALAPDQLKPVKNPSEYLHGKKEGVEHVEKVRGGDDENVDIVPAAAALERVGSALTGASTESDGMGSGQLRGTGGMVV